MNVLSVLAIALSFWRFQAAVGRTMNAAVVAPSGRHPFWVVLKSVAGCRLREGLSAGGAKHRWLSLISAENGFDASV